MLEVIKHWVEVIPTGGMVAIIASAVEFILRMIKSEKPLSIAYLIADGFHAVGKLLDKVGEFLDKVLPQRTKPPQA